jgi:hypothetical protein
MGTSEPHPDWTGNLGREHEDYVGLGFERDMSGDLQTAVDALTEALVAYRGNLLAKHLEATPSLLSELEHGARIAERIEKALADANKIALELIKRDIPFNLGIYSRISHHEIHSKYLGIKTDSWAERDYFKKGWLLPEHLWTPGGMQPSFGPVAKGMLTKKGDVIYLNNPERMSGKDNAYRNQTKYSLYFNAQENDVDEIRGIGEYYSSYARKARKDGLPLPGVNEHARRHQQIVVDGLETVIARFAAENGIDLG